VRRIGPDSVLQYQPLKPTAPGACSDRAWSWPPTAKCRHNRLLPHASWLPRATHATTNRVQRLQPPLPLYAPRMQPPALHLTPHPRSGIEVDHYSPHSYRRAPATPLEPAIATVAWPPSTAASAAPLAPSTLLVALPELKGALQPIQPQPADHLTGAPLRPIIIATVSPPRWASYRHSPQIKVTINRGHSQAIFPLTNDSRPVEFGQWAAGVRGGGWGIPLPCLLGWAETPRELSRLAEKAEALLWAEPKCTVHFLK
jgi:hypothetical protein